MLGSSDGAPARLPALASCLLVFLRARLTGQTKTVIVTEALRRTGDEQLVISVVAVRPGPDGAETVDALQFERFTLLTFS